MTTPIMPSPFVIAALLIGLLLPAGKSHAVPATMDSSGNITQASVTNYNAQVFSIVAAPVFTISAMDYNRNIGTFSDTWMVQAATNSPTGCTIYVSGTPTGNIALGHFYIKPRNLHSQGFLIGSGDAIPVPTSATPIWSSTADHSNRNAFSLDLEMRDLAGCLSGSSGVMLTFYVVPNS